MLPILTVALKSVEDAPFDTIPYEVPVPLDTVFANILALVAPVPILWILIQAVTVEAGSNPVFLVICKLSVVANFSAIYSLLCT